MCYCGVVGSIRFVLLLCFKARREVGKEDWSGKSVETEWRSSALRDAGEDRWALWAEKVITYIINIIEPAFHVLSPRDPRFNIH